VSQAGIFSGTNAISSIRLASRILAGDPEERSEARMQPILFELPGWGLRIHSYGVMILLACTGALWMTIWRARREGLETGVVYELAVWLFLGGVLGARALFVITHPEVVHSVLDLIRSWQGGNVFYGCIMGGLAGSLFYWKRRPFPFWSMADAVAPALAVGITLGRIGCFLAGCCFGRRCDLPWAVQFPRGSTAWLGQVDEGILAPATDLTLPVHPTQLYAAFAGVVILACLCVYFPHRRRDGEVMALLMVLYAMTRWPIESLRGDEPAIFAGITLSQNISVGLFFLGLFVWARLPQRPGVATPEAGTAAGRAELSVSQVHGQLPDPVT
jgi:phosphatidylglycerol:prolipoprotein diacylglycerol transferase